jgi:hypothetical protein
MKQANGVRPTRTGEEPFLTEVLIKAMKCPGIEKLSRDLF